MKANTLPGLFNWVTGFSTKWLGLTIQTETPSLRYVRKLKTRHMKSINGPEAYKEMIMGKIEDRNWKYHKVEESQKPGYLERRMKIYKEMIKNEQNRGIHPQQKNICLQQGNSGSFFNQPKHSKQSPKLVAVGKKG